MADNYKVIKNLASGSYGRIDLVEVKDDYRTIRGHQFKKGDQAAMKTFTTDEGETTGDAVREVDILNRVNHPNVVGAYDSFSKMESGACKGINVVLPLAIGDLHGFDRKSVTLKHLFQILCGVHYLHRNFIIHNDLKPQNILAFGGEKKMPEDWTIQKSRSTGKEYYANTITGITTFDRPFPFLPENSILKVADFGISNIVEGTSDIDSYESDIWSLGVIFYEYSVGINPFRRGLPKNIPSQTLYADASPSASPGTPSDTGSERARTRVRLLNLLDKGFNPQSDKMEDHPVFKSGEFKGLGKLIVKMLDPDPSKRVTAGEALKSNIFNRFKCLYQRWSLFLGV